MDEVNCWHEQVADAMCSWMHLLSGGVCRVPEQCPQEVWDLIDRCLKPNPDDRLDAEDIVDLLKDLDAKSKATSNLIDPPCEELA